MQSLALRHSTALAPVVVLGVQYETAVY